MGKEIASGDLIGKVNITGNAAPESLVGVLKRTLAIGAVIAVVAVIYFAGRAVVQSGPINQANRVVTAEESPTKESVVEGTLAEPVEPKFITVEDLGYSEVIGIVKDTGRSMHILVKSPQSGLDIMCYIPGNASDRDITRYDSGKLKTARLIKATNSLDGRIAYEIMKK